MRLADQGSSTASVSAQAIHVYLIVVEYVLLYETWLCCQISCRAPSIFNLPCKNNENALWWF